MYTARESRTWWIYSAAVQFDCSIVTVTCIGGSVRIMSATDDHTSGGMAVKPLSLSLSLSHTYTHTRGSTHPPATHTHPPTHIIHAHRHNLKNRLFSLTVIADPSSFDSTHEQIASRSVPLHWFNSGPCFGQVGPVRRSRTVPRSVTLSAIDLSLHTCRSMLSASTGNKQVPPRSVKLSLSTRSRSSNGQWQLRWFKFKSSDSHAVSAI